MKKIRSSTPEIIFLLILGTFFPAILSIQGGILIWARKTLRAMPKSYEVIDQIIQWITHNNVRMVLIYEVIVLGVFCIFARIFLTKPYSNPPSSVAFFFLFVLHLIFGISEDPEKMLDEFKGSTFAIVLIACLASSYLLSFLFNRIYKKDIEVNEKRTAILDAEW